MSMTFSSPHSSSSPSDGPIPDDPHTAADLPLPMTASVMLEHLPRDAQTALEKAGELGRPDRIEEPVTIRLQPIASAPALRQRVFKISSSQRFEAVIKFLRRKLAGPAPAPTDPSAVQPNASAASPAPAAGGGSSAPASASTASPSTTAATSKRKDKEEGESAGQGGSVAAAALREHESVFCYINNVFAPSPDENVGNLWRCFRSGDELVVGYAVAPAFG
ncbi:hypothetical protein B0A49_04912 [Cryomyces minteri]|uniref:Ubiquitin-like protein ATG12 n=1 Tax=Cryomyces minteri TaxID=331657 RepID=A0A4U0WWK0_9PEZI|nr:hypothetical protein B0A49_04912 [Cryomyces minteri]